MTRRTIRLSTTARHLSVPLGFALALAAPAAAQAVEAPSSPAPTTASGQDAAPVTATETGAPAPVETTGAPAPDATQAVPAQPIEGVVVPDGPAEAPVETASPAPVETTTPAPVETATPVQTADPATIGTTTPPQDVAPTETAPVDQPAPSGTVIPAEPADQPPAPASAYIAGEGNNATPVAPPEGPSATNPTTTGAPPKPGEDAEGGAARPTAEETPATTPASPTHVPAVPSHSHDASPAEVDAPSTTHPSEPDPTASATAPAGHVASPTHTHAPADAVTPDPHGSSAPVVVPTVPEESESTEPCPVDEAPQDEKVAEPSVPVEEPTAPVDAPTQPVAPTQPATPTGAPVAERPQDSDEQPCRWDVVGTDRTDPEIDPVTDGPRSTPPDQGHHHEHAPTIQAAATPVVTETTEPSVAPTESTSWVAPDATPSEASESAPAPEESQAPVRPAAVEPREEHPHPRHPHSDAPVVDTEPTQSTAPRVDIEPVTSEPVESVVIPQTPAEEIEPPADGPGEKEKHDTPPRSTVTPRPAESEAPEATETTRPTHPERPTVTQTVTLPPVVATPAPATSTPAAPATTPAESAPPIERPTVTEGPSRIIPTGPPTSAPTTGRATPRSPSSAPATTSQPTESVTPPPAQDNREPEPTWQPPQPTVTNAPLVTRPAPQDAPGEAPVVFEPTAAPSQVWKSGIVAPLGNFDYVKSATKARGAAPSVVQMTLPGRSWDEVSAKNPVFAETRRTKGAYAWSIPLDMAGAGLADVAAGRYDTRWDELAGLLAASPTPVTVRLTMPADTDPATAKAAYRRVAQILTERSSKVQLEWVAPMGTTPEQSLAAYPGSDVVTFIGITAPLAGSWQTTASGPGGLYDWTDFAEKQGKKISVLWSLTKESNEPWVKNFRHWIELTAARKQLAQENVLVTRDADESALETYTSLW